MSILIFMGVYLLLYGVWTCIVRRYLRKEYRKSEYETFLEFYEVEYLKKSGTWRRNWRWYYNSKLFFIISSFISVVSIMLGILFLGLVIFVALNR